MIKIQPDNPTAFQRFYTVTRVGGHCPHCKTGTTFTKTTDPNSALLSLRDVKSIIVNYTCDMCFQPIPIQWDLKFDGNEIFVANPREVLRVREPFNFEHVPTQVSREIEEGLDCLSVHAYHGFATQCRRAMQAICTNLGAEKSSKIRDQLNELMELTGLEKETQELARQIMLSGHDGAHPHLPEVNEARARVLLSLLADLVYQIHTRQGKIREAAKLRQEAIEKKK